MSIRLALVGLGSLVLLTGCPSGPKIEQPEQPAINKTFVHAPSGFEFPPSVGNATRNVVKQNDQEGLSISVGYHLLQLDRFTISVYPVRDQAPDDTIDNQFEIAREEIMRAHAGAKEAVDEPVTMPISQKERSGRHGSFKYKAYYLSRHQTMFTDVYLFQDGKWFVKYEVTFAEGDRDMGVMCCNEFLRVFPWAGEGDMAAISPLAQRAKAGDKRDKPVKGDKGEKSDKSDKAEKKP
jgi:hypothetical protein